MSEAAKALGKGGFLPYKGVRYALKPFDLDGIAMFTAWLENRAWETVERTKDKCDPVVYGERHAAISRMVAAGEFEYGGQIAQKAALTVPGRKFILWWMLSSAPENAALEVSERLVEDIFKDWMDEAVARMNEANSDPNPPAPETQPGPAESPISPPCSSESPGVSDPGKSAS